MDNFSWQDSFQAIFGPCLACLHKPPQLESDDELDQNASSRNPNRRARSDELEGLLADTDDAETLSLHSHIGDRDHKRKKKRKPKKAIKVFGYDLFGRPPIHLTDDEDETQAEGSSGRREGHGQERQRTISSSSMDAAPLDPSTIERMSAAQVAAKVAAEEEERRAKEERRRKRREKKELKRASLAMALHQAGFPDHDGHTPSPFHRSMVDGADTPSTAISSPAPFDDFGPFEHGQATHVQSHLDADDADFDGADFGGASYARRTGASNSGGTGSDSRSRTSGSISNADSSRYNHHYLAQEAAVPLPRSPHEFPVATDLPKKKRKSKSAKHSVSTASQSVSLPSPPPEQSTFSPMIASQEATAAPTPQDFPTTKLSNGGFPSTGLRGPGMHRKNSEAGVFLARRGDE